MKFNSFAVKCNINRQITGPDPVSMMWIAQGWIPSVPHEPRSEKIWQTLFTSDCFKPIIRTTHDMRKFNRKERLKMRVCVFVMIPENSKEENFREF